MLEGWKVEYPGSDKLGRQEEKDGGFQLVPGKNGSTASALKSVVLKFQTFLVLPEDASSRLAIRCKVGKLNKCAHWGVLSFGIKK